jgi:hypothetical protein
MIRGKKIKQDLEYNQASWFFQVRRRLDFVDIVDGNGGVPPQPREGTVQVAR